MRSLPIFIAIGLLPAIAQAQVYIGNDAFIPEPAIVHANDYVRVSNTATVYDNGTLQSNATIEVSGSNYIRMGGNGHVITTIPSAQATAVAIGIHSNNTMVLQQNSGQPLMYKIGIDAPVFENPESKGTAITSGIADRTWRIEPLTQTGITDITLGWNSPEELNINRDSTTVATWKQGSSTRWTRNGHAPANNTAADPAYQRTVSMNMDAGNTYYLHISDTTTPTGIPEIVTEGSHGFFTLYPNPAGSTVNYSFQSREAGTHYVVMHDLAGRRLFTKSHAANNEVITGNIDAGALASGVYMLTLQTANKKIETKSIIIAHQ